MKLFKSSNYWIILIALFCVSGCVPVAEYSDKVQTKFKYGQEVVIHSEEVGNFYNGTSGTIVGHYVDIHGFSRFSIQTKNGNQIYGIYEWALESNE